VNRLASPFAHDVSPAYIGVGVKIKLVDISILPISNEILSEGIGEDIPTVTA
jgi:hypothetical protein